MDIRDRLAKVSFHHVKPDLCSLYENEKQALAHCVNASNIMTFIYLEQAFAGNKQLYRELKARSDDEGKNLFQYFMIHGCPWDGFHHEEPFIPGIGPKPKFGSFYPKDMTESEWNAWLAAHPDDREQFESNYTTIKRFDNGLIAVRYAHAYGVELSDAQCELRSAAALLPEGPLRTFLKLRAEAFCSNDYFDSDMAWVDTDGTPFEVTIGPYETYFDELLGIKASFESFIGIPDRDATMALKKFTPVVPEFDGILSEEFNFTPKGAAIPLQVMADVTRGGEGRFGAGFVAYNLPNDRRVHEAKGSKKVFSRTMMQAKYEKLGLPAVERLLRPDLRDHCSFQNRLLFILGHEISHGLGPSRVLVDGREMPFEVALKDLHSSLEEAKADMLGMRLITHFAKCGLIDEDTLAGITIGEIMSPFNSWRHGLTEAHSRGSLIEHNWLRAADAVRHNGTTGFYDVDVPRAIDAMVRLSTEFLKLQVAGDYDRAQRFMNEWSTVPKELPAVLERLSDVPLAVSPVFDLSELQ